MKDSISIYVGGTFGFETKNPVSNDARKDFRHRLVGDAFLYEQDVTVSGISYVGCFYYYKQGDTQETIVMSELNAIEKSDVVCLVFNSHESQGTQSELLYASLLKKETYVFYVEEPGVQSNNKFRTRFWWPFTMSTIIGGNVTFNGYGTYENACNACIEKIMELSNGCC